MSKIDKFKQLETIYELNRALTQATTLPDVFDEVLGALQKALDIQRAAILLLDENAKMRFQAWVGLSARYRGAVEGHSPWQPDDRDVEPILISDVETDPDIADFRVTILEEDIRALAFIPLLQRGRIIGKFMLYHNKPDTFSPEDLQVATTIAGHVAFAVTRIQAEDDLRSSQRRFKDLFDNAPDMYFVFEPDGEILDVNKKGVELLGFSKEHLLTKNITDFIHPEDVEIALQTIETILAEKQINQNGEVRFLSKDGSTVWCSNQFSVVRQSDGDISLIRIACRDITEKRQLEEDLARSHRLESAGRVAGQIAHDFNNLLAPLTAYPSLIREDLRVGRDVSMLIDEMEAAAKKIADINQQLLALGRRGHYKMEPVNLNDLLEKVLFTNMLPKKVVVSRDFAGDLKLVKGGPAQLTRAATNLIRNSVEAMQSIGALKIKTENNILKRPYNNVPAGEYVKVTITDEGCGIEPEIREQIFEPFFTTKTMDKMHGSGLGLSIVHGIIEDHGGHITVKSQPDFGTSFSLYFPTTSERASTDEIYLPMSKNGEEGVLVVDDDPVQRRVIQELLKRLGYKTQVAATGEEAISLCTKHRFDLLILDMIMVGIDGAETYSQILQSHPEQRAIIMSGFAMSQRVEAALSLGAHNFVTKPVQFHELATAVRNALDTEIKPI